MGVADDLKSALSRVPHARHLSDVKNGVPEARAVATCAWTIEHVDSSPASWAELEASIDAYLSHLRAKEDFLSTLRRRLAPGHESGCDCMSCRPWTT